MTESSRGELYQHPSNDVDQNAYTLTPFWVVNVAVDASVGQLNGCTLARYEEVAVEPAEAP
jgi:hypothetical protein